MKKFFDNLLKSILTGIAIGIGGVVFLQCENRYIGSFLFGTGLFVILTFGFNLFTGKVGYAVENKPSYIPFLGVVWLGNLAGTFIAGTAVRCTRIADGVAKKADALCDIKLDDNLISIFILSIFCGMLMFIAADGYKNIKNPIAQMLAVFLPVIVFILSGYEHCVANMFYFSVAGAWSLKAFGYLIIMSLGNAAGGILIPLVRKAFIKEN